jgi:uncharacterized protein YdeI (BOF family)
MNAYFLFTTATAAALISATAMANMTNATIKKMEDKSQVTVTGTVDSVQNEREFTLRDSTGTMEVDITSGQSVVLRDGQEVTVSGMLDKGLTGDAIAANDVQVHKGLMKSAGDAISSIPGVSTTNAQAYNIKDLPKEGFVKVSGTVSEVDSEKQFTLQDGTGSINVDIASSENAAITAGSEVTVIGNIQDGVLGKDIEATKVLVVADVDRAAN